MSIQPTTATDPIIAPPAKHPTPAYESFGACFKRVFTAFCKAIKKLIADIQAFFQRLMGKDTNNPLKKKEISVETNLPKTQTPMEPPRQARPEPVQQQSANIFIETQPAALQVPQAEASNIAALKEKTKEVLNRKEVLEPRNTTPTVSAEVQPTELTAYEREHRIRKGAANIEGRLEREWQHAQNQMERETDKPFVYQEAVEKFPGKMEQARIGNYEIGLCHFQGAWRDSMEDEHYAHVLPLTIGEKQYSVPLFAVMDGHGGNLCAQFVRDNLLQTLHDALKEFNPQSLTDEGIWNALKFTGVRLHEQFCAQFFIGKDVAERDISGTTLVFSIILDGKLWTANIGDSRAVLDNNGVAFQLSEDAKPADPEDHDPEITRYNRGIVHRGGTVVFWGDARINGRLACARSIGDPEVEGANSARAKITMISLSTLNPNSHLVLGCDGIFDVASTKQIANAVHQNSSLKLGTLAKNIVFSTETSGTRDNQSIMIVKLT